MASIESCRYDIRRYNTIKANVQNIINYLNNYNNQCEDLAREIKKVYSVDNEDTNLYNSVNAIKNDVQKTSNYLKNTIIPSINNAVKELNRQISSLQAEQASK